VQYACDAFRKTLADLKFIQSMSAKGNCYDNGVPRINYRGGAA
jgi:transposase InsO family protein